MKTFLKFFRIILGVCLAWPIFIIAMIASALHEILDFVHLPKAADAVFKPLALIVCWWMMIALGGIMHISGRENIPEGEAVIFTPNHNSICDVPVFFLSKGSFCSMMAKKETWKAPVVHGLLNALDCVPIKRNSAHGVVEAIHQGTAHLEKGRSLVVFPEGTRNKKNEVAAFKSGAFKMAQRAGCRIVPVVIKNDRFTWETGHFGFVHIYVEFLPPVSAAGLDDEAIKTLMEKVEGEVREKFNSYPTYS